MDDYSRYIITWELCSNMETDDAKRVVGEAILESGIGKDQHPRLLTDNGFCYISGEFKKFIDEVDLGHVQGAPYHPQNCQKMNTEVKLIKSKLGLINLAEELGNVSQACKVMGYSRDTFLLFIHLIINNLSTRKL